ncbi:MAG: DUF1501 domain-containing protein [Planctomycetota bacterium]
MRTPITRRELLKNASGGFGAIALAGMLQESELKAATQDPLAARSAHLRQRAKRVIFIFLNGGLSHIDSFDHKPKLFRDAGKTVKFYEWQGKPGDYNFYLKRPQWEFRRGGKSGLLVSDLFPHMRNVADELCVINSLESDHTNHYEASLGMHTGSITFARPSLGSWVSYGLGTENRQLPSFVVVSPTLPYAGTQAFASDFLPGTHQGTHITPGAEPIANLRPKSRSREQQRLELDFLNRVNRESLGGTGPEGAALEARIRSFETAFGMQSAAPEIFDFSQEREATLKLYGLDRNSTTGFAWQCLVARRFAERGVRFIELVNSNWDQHGDMMGHVPLAKQVDQPIAALIQDLKQRGMLDDTLVVLTTEFGRTPHHTAKDAKGREHHHQAFTSVLAGAGVKAGYVHGESDDYGIEVANDRVHLHDFHATLLHLLGIDHERLTYRHAGRDYRLTDVHGEVAHSILA